MPGVIFTEMKTKEKLFMPDKRQQYVLSKYKRKTGKQYSLIFTCDKENERNNSFTFVSSDLF